MLKARQSSVRKAIRQRLFSKLLQLSLVSGSILSSTMLHAQLTTQSQPPQVAQQMPNMTRQTANVPANSQATLMTYNVPSQLIGTVGAQLQLLYHNTPGVTITSEPQTQQLMVMAPSAVQQQIGESLRRLMTQSGIPVGDQGVATKSVDERNYVLANITWRELEDALGRLAGSKLEVTTEKNGELAQLQIANAHGQKDTLRVDRRNNIVSIRGTTPTVSAWSQIIHSLDMGQADPNASTHIIPLAPAQPRSINRMIKLVKAQLPQQGNFQDDPNNPDGPATAVIQQGGITESGLLGDVQIEVVESVGLIIVKGSKRDVQRVLQVIEEIKKQAQLTEPQVEILQLQHANSEAVSNLVTQLYQNVYQPRQGSVSITALVQPNALLLIGRPEVVQSVKELVAKIDMPLESTDQLKVIRLEHAAATDLETRIRDFFAGTATGVAGAIPQAQPAVPGGAGGQTSFQGGLATKVRISSDYRTNSLIIKASPREVAEVEKLVMQLDVESSQTENRVQVFPLKHAVAQELQSVLTQIITGQAATGGQQQGAFGQQQPFGAAAGGAQAGAANNRASTPSGKLSYVTIDGKKIESGVLAGVVISADPSVNSLVVRAPAPSMPLIAKLISELDVLPSAEARMKIFQLKNSDATTVALTLQNLFGLSPSAGQGSQFALQSNLINNLRTQLTTGGDNTLIQLRITPEARSNSVIVTGADSDLTVIEALILRLDADLAASRRSEVIWLRHANATDVATALQNYFQTVVSTQTQLVNQGVISIQELVNRQLVVVADNLTNSVLLSASNSYFETAMRMIERLDRRPPLVTVQVLMAEVSLNDSLEFGTELGLQDSLLYSRKSSSGGTLGSNVFNTGTAITSPTAAANLAGQSLSAFNMGRANSNGVGGAVLAASSETVGILVRALQTAGRLEVLNRPQLTTLDNREAVSTVGGKVPRVTTIQSASTVTGQSFGVTDTDFGVILRLLPRVSPDGLILMRVSVENSSVGDPNNGIPIGFSAAGLPIRSPIINSTQAETWVTAYPGQTVVFAGLISKTRQSTRSQVPILGSIPLIGAAFRFDVESDIRKELLVVLTPRLIQTDEEYETLKQVESSRMSWCLADVLSVHGDQGLSQGNGLWGPARAPVIFPNMPANRVPDRAEHNLDNNYPINGGNGMMFTDPSIIEPSPAPVPMSYEDLEAAKARSNQLQPVSYQSGDVKLQTLPSGSSQNGQSNGSRTSNSMPRLNTGGATSPSQTPGVQNGSYR
ncbi:MAG: secretin N-terminal domain-containing protein [Pirellulales bacterium]